jgi:hypothetical protein
MSNNRLKTELLSLSQSITLVRGIAEEARINLSHLTTPVIAQHDFEQLLTVIESMNELVLEMLHRLNTPAKNEKMCDLSPAEIVEMYDLFHEGVK